MNLLLGSVARLRRPFDLVLFLLTIESFLAILQVSPLIFFLADVPLDAKHQKDLLSELIVELHVFFGSDNLFGNVHPLKNFLKTFIDLARQVKGLIEILLATVDKLLFFHFLFAMHLF